VTEVGTAATVLLLVKETLAPPAPAGPVKVTVPVDGSPPRTLAGFRLIDASAAGVMVSVAFWLIPAKVAVITALVCEFTPMVVTVKVTELFPAGTVTEAGTVAAIFPLESVTFVPAGPAPPVSVTVPVDGLPPSTVVGLKVSEANVAAVIVRTAFSD